MAANLKMNNKYSWNAHGFFHSIAKHNGIWNSYDNDSSDFNGKEMKRLDPLKVHWNTPDLHYNLIVAHNPSQGT